MPPVPETRASLILRLPSAADADAWQQFVSIYEPFVYRYARRGGLQEADALELVQNVLLAVARAVGDWQPEAERGKFRTWLFRIARNQLIDISRKLQRQISSRGGTTSVGLMGRATALENFSGDGAALNHRRELFRWAANRVQHDVKPATWQAFWMTAVEDRSVDEVAKVLGISTGAVYIARSRVFSRLRDEVNQWEGSDAM